MKTNNALAYSDPWEEDDFVDEDYDHQDDDNQDGYHDEEYDADGMKNEKSVPVPEPGMFFRTEYDSSQYKNMTGNKPQSFFGDMEQNSFFAPDFATAKKMVAERGMNEKLIAIEGTSPPLTLPSEWFEAGNIPQALHAACWLGFVAMQAGTATSDELLSDGGLIHSLAHLNLPRDNYGGADDSYQKIKNLVRENLKRLENLTPGFTRTKPYDLQAQFKSFGRDMKSY